VDKPFRAVLASLCRLREDGGTLLVDRCATREIDRQRFFPDRYNGQSAGALQSGVAMTRDELLDDLLNTVELLSSSQLKQANALLEGLAYPERSPAEQRDDQPQAADNHSYKDFIAELSSRPRTSGEPA
jgi:hypothetical protein